MNIYEKLVVQIFIQLLKLYNSIRTRKFNKKLILDKRFSDAETLSNSINRTKYLNEHGYENIEFFTKEKDYLDYKVKINKKLKLFDNLWFQSGSLDDEIDLIIDLATATRAKTILEIGVANGYSSSFIFKYAEKNQDTKVISIDLPRFEPPHSNIGLIAKMIKRVLRSGIKIETTGTVLDVRPGGIIPKNKWCGWMVPSDLRLEVDNRLFIGDVFNLLKKLSSFKFDLILIDAMKDYDSRYKLLDECSNLLSKDGIITLDGSWINSSFIDFCEQGKYEYSEIGRIGWLKNRKS